jgi:nicotinamidase-related amidase
MPMKSTKRTVAVAVTLTAFSLLIALAMQLQLVPVQAQTKQAQSANASATPFPGLSRQPTAAARDALIDPSDAVILLLDHQTGLLQTVKDVPPDEVRNNAVALINIAQLAGAPVLMTASEPNGPNGPLIEELQKLEGKGVQYVGRKGEISAWDNADFVTAVEATGRKTLIIAGIWTSVCVNFPALQAKADGYKVYFVTDASGDPSVLASETTIARAVQEGIIPVSTNVVLCELQRTWNRPDAAKWGALYSDLVPNYRAAVESYHRAQEAAKGAKK